MNVFCTYLEELETHKSENVLLQKAIDMHNDCQKLINSMPYSVTHAHLQAYKRKVNKLNEFLYKNYDTIIKQLKLKFPPNIVDAIDDHFLMAGRKLSKTNANEDSCVQFINEAQVWLHEIIRKLLGII